MFTNRKSKTEREKERQRERIGYEQRWQLTRNLFAYKLVGYFLCSRSLRAFSLNLQNIISGIYSLFLQTLQNGTEESVCFVVFSFLCVTVYSDSSLFLKSIAYTLCFSLRGLTPNPAIFETGYHQPLSFGASDSSHYRAIA